MQSENIKINIVGDIVLPSYEENKKYKIKYLKKFLSLDSINIGNLESVILKNPPEKNQYKIENKKIVLFSLEESISFLKDLNINIVSLANNHIFDFGCEGFNETIQILKKYNIKWFGAGKNLKSSFKPLIIRYKDIKIGFIGMGWDFIGSINSSKNKYGVTPLHSYYLPTIKIFKKKVDYLIIFLHWGYELERYPLPYQREMAHKMIELGANFIIGSHPHRIQGIEKCLDGIIVYSVGNLLIPQKEYLKGYLIPSYPKFSNFSFIFHLELSKNKVINYRKIPFKLINYKFSKLSNEHLFLKIIEKLSEPFRQNKKEYYHFFKKNRKNRHLPILTEKIWLNKILLLSYKFKKKIFPLFSIIST